MLRRVLSVGKAPFAAAYSGMPTINSVSVCVRRAAAAAAASAGRHSGNGVSTMTLARAYSSSSTTRSSTPTPTPNPVHDHDAFVATYGFREGLPRWPNVHTPTGILRSLDWFGTVVFAASGALTAATCGCDALGTVAVGTITAVGGGTIRDAVVLNKLPFWFEEWEYLVMSMLAAAGVFFCWGELEAGKRYRIGDVDLGTLKSADGGEGEMMAWGDAIGFGAFAAIGAMNGIRANAPFLVSCICGMMSCTFGGLTRDTLLNRPVRILHPYADAYASVAFAGAAGYLALRQLAPSMQAARIAATVCGVIAARREAESKGWRLPWWALDGSQRVVGGDCDPRKVVAAAAVVEKMEKEKNKWW
jgi:hypothetical protein